MDRPDGFAGRLGSIKHNEAAKLVLLAVIVVSLSYGGWAALRLMMATEHPVLVVVSGSMVPTLNVGDIIFIKGSPAENIDLGTIVVFHSPREYDTLVVHRVVQKIDSGGAVYFKTKGDFNRYQDDWTVPEDHIVGIYAARIPYLGIVVMRLREPAGTVLIIILIVLLISHEIHGERSKRKRAAADLRTIHRKRRASE
ncbi:signal peptidase I [Candidatus Bathyarchaeota archaeon]|nr:signal peptidase I [Candidatus Bathyarchaeota archaeon]